MKLHVKFTTPIIFHVQTTAYVSGQGVTKTWEKYESMLSDGSKMSVFFCEWVGSFGEIKFAAQAQGVSDSARIRMPFIPELYAELKSQKVVIAKNADATVIVDNAPDASNANAYKVWGSVDNIREESQYMEFNVQRYEVQ